MNWSNIFNVFLVLKVDSVEISAQRTMFGSSAIAVLFLLIFYLWFDNKGFIVVGQDSFDVVHAVSAYFKGIFIENFEHLS